MLLFIDFKCECIVREFLFICEKYKIKLISVPSKASTGKYTVD